MADRTILHIDMNAFYASVECLHHPEISHLPVAVGGDQKKRHGIILAKNQLAKAAGVKTGEALWQARQKCPGLCIVPPHFSQYLHYSQMAKEIYYSYTQQVEPFGLDEAWLDVSGCDGWLLAEKIRQRIRKELGLTVSIGVSWSKVFAKLGSDLKKPDACTLISRENYKDVVWPLPVENLLYVGPSGFQKLRQIGVRSIGQLAALPPSFLHARFGKTGLMLSLFANGEDGAIVRDMNQAEEIKSVGNSVTTPRDILCEKDAKIVFCGLCESVGKRLRENGLAASGLGISIRDTSLHSEQYQLTLPRLSNINNELIDAALKLFREHWHWRSPIRSLGVRTFSLQAAGSEQLAFFQDEKRRIKWQVLDQTIDELRERYGADSLLRGLMLRNPGGK